MGISSLLAGSTECLEPKSSATSLESVEQPIVNLNTEGSIPEHSNDDNDDNEDND